ncbi:MAG TPA: DUF669 domain-containing protein [bacterium]|nr:DUF669 domain-containing protein [bacterium]HPI75792.1 DUF669 domain-containing protein [bacterium]HPN95866.1 DUF669 domain-containing protein [bacterium]
MTEENYEGEEGAVDKFDLARWNDEYAAAPVEPREYDNIPDGKYQVVVDRVELTKSLSSGNTMLKWKLKVLGPKHEGAVLWRNNVIATKGNVHWLKGDLHACGLELETFEDLPANLERLLDVRLEVTKKTRGENENIYINRRLVSDATGDNIDQELQKAAEKVF